MRQFMLACSVFMAGASPLPALAVCAGDCEDDGTVTIDEVITGLGIALGDSPLAECEPIDNSDDQCATVDEIILAVNNTLNACPMGQATPTPNATPTPTVAANISPDLLGIFAGTGVNAFTGGSIQVRLEVKLEGGTIVVKDLNGNLFTTGSSITVMSLNPTTLFFAANNPGRTETLQIALNPSSNTILNGTYANITTTLPPTGTSVALVLNKQS